MPSSLSIINYTDQVNQWNSVHKENNETGLHIVLQAQVCMYVAHLKPDTETSAFTWLEKMVENMEGPD